MMDRDIVRDGEAIIISVGKYTEVTCCDCGLTHDQMLTYDPQRMLVALVLRRNEAETKKARTRMKRRKEGVFKK